MFLLHKYVHFILLNILLFKNSIILFCIQTTAYHGFNPFHHREYSVAINKFNINGNVNEKHISDAVQKIKGISTSTLDAKYQQVCESMTNFTKNVTDDTSDIDQPKFKIYILRDLQNKFNNFADQFNVIKSTITDARKTSKQMQSDAYDNGNNNIWPLASEVHEIISTVEEAMDSLFIFSGTLIEVPLNQKIDTSKCALLKPINDLNLQLLSILRACTDVINILFEIKNL